MGNLNRPESEFDRLCLDFRYCVSASRRLNMISDFAAYGPAAIEPLSEALRDEDPRVRVAAAGVLGKMGDRRAIKPLLAALRNTFAWRTPYLQIVAGIALTLALGVLGAGAVFVGLIGLAVLVAIGIVFLDVSISFAELFTGAAKLIVEGVVNFVKWPFDYIRYRRKKNAFCLHIAQALVQIAERSPTPELREALPDLAAVADDFIQQEPLTRDRAKEMKRRIEALTDKLRYLPAPAKGVHRVSGNLPRRAASSPSGDLPKVVAEQRLAAREERVKTKNA